MTIRLHLVRHGRPAMDPGTPAATWPLADDTAAYEVLAAAAGFPRAARWFVRGVAATGNAD